MRGRHNNIKFFYAIEVSIFKRDVKTTYIFISLRVTTKQKTFSRSTKDYNKVVKAHHHSKSSNHKGRELERKQGTKKSYKKSENNEQTMSTVVLTYQ